MNTLIRNSKMENPLFMGQKPMNPKSIKSRLFSSSNLFTRLETRCSRIRESKTSKDVRGYGTLSKANILSDSKEKLNFQSYLSKVRSGLNFDEKAIVSKCLNALRKDYDKIVMAIKQKQVKINRMKKQITFMKKKATCFSDRFTDLNSITKVKETSVKNVQEKQEQVIMEGKILQSIVFRMKTDQLFHKNQSRLKDNEIKQKQKQAKINEETLLQWDDNIHKLIEKNNMLKGIFAKNSQERADKLNDYEERLQCLQDKEKFQLQRKERTYQLLSLESNDIMDAKNIVMREILLTNMLLDRLLKNKISAILIKNQDLQNAFHLIKTQTSISDPKALTKKFFSYSQLSEDLLNAISHSQQSQQELLKRKQELERSVHDIENRTLEEQKTSKSQQQEYYLKKISLIEEISQKELLMKKIRSWVEKKSELVGTQGKNGMYIEFKRMCDKLKQQIEELGQDTSLMDQKYQYGGIRLKKLMRQVSIEEEKLRKSEAQELNESNIMQSQYMLLERQRIKKNQFVIKTHMNSQSKL